MQKKLFYTFIILAMLFCVWVDGARRRDACTALPDLTLVLPARYCSWRCE